MREQQNRGPSTAKVWYACFRENILKKNMMITKQREICSCKSTKGVNWCERVLQRDRIVPLNKCWHLRYDLRSDVVVLQREREMDHSAAEIEKTMEESVANGERTVQLNSWSGHYEWVWSCKENYVAERVEALLVWKRINSANQRGQIIEVRERCEGENNVPLKINEFWGESVAKSKRAVQMNERITWRPA